MRAHPHHQPDIQYVCASLMIVHAHRNVLEVCTMPIKVHPPPLMSQYTCKVFPTDEVIVYLWKYSTVQC